MTASEAGTYAIGFTPEGDTGQADCQWVEHLAP